MRREQLMAAFADGKILKARKGICPVCGTGFKRDYKVMTCGAKFCIDAVRDCATAAALMQKRQQAELHDFAAAKAARDARRAGETCADMFDPWLVKYSGDVIRTADPALGF